VNFELFIGWDPRLTLAWHVTARSALAVAERPPTVRAISSTLLGAEYGRPTLLRDGRLVDGVSNAPMSTEFSLARFYVPHVCKSNWAIFCDGDFLWRSDPARLLDEVDPRFAVSVVKHDHQPAETIKMDGQLQTRYPRKNWSSLMVWNLQHAGSRRLSPFDLNTRNGLWLHGLQWLKDEEIGALDARWNWLEGTDDPQADPHAVHFTRGTPNMPGYESVPFASEWRNYLTEPERTAPCAQAA
jgi:hypothetical protein